MAAAKRVEEEEKKMDTVQESGVESNPAELREGEYIVPFGGEMRPFKNPNDWWDNATCEEKAAACVSEAITMLREIAGRVPSQPGHLGVGGAQTDLLSAAARLEALTLPNCRKQVC